MAVCIFRLKSVKRIETACTLFSLNRDTVNLYLSGFHLGAHWISNKTHLCGSVEDCLTRDRGAAGPSLTGVTALWSLSKTHLSWLSTGSTQ